jgi:hypothetical protein
MSATHDATQKLIAAIDAMTNSVAEVCVTLTRAQHLAQDVQGQQRARDAQIADAGIEVATARTREADKVARLRSRIFGLLAALRESQEQARMNYATAEAHCRGLSTHVAAAEERGALAAEERIRGLRAELGNALRIGTQYRESAEQLQASLDKLHGHKFSERVHGVLVARAAQAEERAKRLEEIADQALDGWAELEEVAVANGIGNYSDHPAKIRDLRVKLHGELAPPAEREDEPDPIEEERPQVCKFGAPGCPGWPHNASDAAKICPAHEELYERARRAGMPASGRHG